MPAPICKSERERARRWLSAHRRGAAAEDLSGAWLRKRGGGASPTLIQTWDGGFEVARSSALFSRLEAVPPGRRTVATQTTEHPLCRSESWTDGPPHLLSRHLLFILG